MIVVQRGVFYWLIMYLFVCAMAECGIGRSVQLCVCESVMRSNRWLRAIVGGSAMLFAVGAAVPSSSTTARGWWQQDNEAAVNAVIAQQQDGDEVKADGEIEVGREVRLTMKDGRTFRGEPSAACL